MILRKWYDLPTSAGVNDVVILWAAINDVLGKMTLPLVQRDSFRDSGPIRKNKRRPGK